MDRYRDRRVLVTGASSGIGQATAVRLIAEGATVAGLGRSQDGLSRTAGLVADSARFFPIACDLDDPATPARAVETARAHLGGLDVLVNVAGMTDQTPADALDRAGLDHVFTVNCFAPMLLCREALPVLPDGDGVIVNVCSTSATQAHPGMTAYAASKAALLSYSLSLAAELSARRIRVVALSPGGVRTPMMDGTVKELDLSWYSRLLPLWGDPGEPEDVAAVIATIGSRDGAYLNGTEVRLDGGARSAL